MVRHQLWGGVLLVAGTATGAAMLALPICTGFWGFFPSLFIMFLCWAYLTYTAFLFLEVTLWFEGEINLISMAKRTLGYVGEWFSWGSYLFLLYALTTAYIAGCSSICKQFFEVLFGFKISLFTSILPLLFIFGLFVYKGVRWVDYINRFFMVGLCLSYVLLLIVLSPYVKGELLYHCNIKQSLLSVSVIVTSFGFHIIIPSLTTYLNKDVRNLKKVLLIGSSVPVLVYLVWEMIALGIIPIEGDFSIRSAYEKGMNGALILSKITQNAFIASIASGFSFFAIVTSLLGVTLSLFDFLADGFKIKKSRIGKVLLFLLTFTPPLIFSLTETRAFLSALEYAGAFGVVTLLGLLPALMVWRGRYCLRFESKYQVKGGKLALILVMGFSFLVIVIEILAKTGKMAAIINSIS